MESICTAKSWTEKGLIKDLTSPNNPNRIWGMAGFVLHYRLIVHSNLYPNGLASQVRKARSCGTSGPVGTSAAFCGL